MRTVIKVKLLLCRLSNAYQKTESKTPFFPLSVLNSAIVQDFLAVVPDIDAYGGNYPNEWRTGYG